MAKEDSENSLGSSFKSFLSSLSEILNITDNAQPEITIEGIKRDIDFKGFNVWILILAIFIASIGLNVNSTAVIIGAMLISPLMGPIMGVGLSIGINDLFTLKRSLRSFGIAVIVSLVTSTLYFSITPLSDAQSELLARTQPNLLDVFIAFFGGLAGILAGSRKEKNNVVPGVAIATALMPPLCTAGYGIGTGQWNYFLGAFYLFLINSIFIAIATSLVVRYLKFPLTELPDKRTERKTRRLVSWFAIVTALPAIWVFFNTVTDSLYKRRAELFVKEIISYEGTEIVKKEILNYDSIQTIKVTLIGNFVPNEVLEDWERKMLNYQLLGTKLKIVQGNTGDNQESGDYQKLVELYSNSQFGIHTKDQEILSLKERISTMEKMHMGYIKLTEEVKASYPELQKFDIAFIWHSNFSTIDTIPSFTFYWPKTMNNLEISNDSKRLENWLKARLDLDTAVFRSMHEN